MIKTSLILIIATFIIYFSSSLTDGYIQKIVLYESDKDDGDFVGLTREGVEDIQKLSIGPIKKICTRGWWLLYNDTNFNTFWKPIGSMGCRIEDFSNLKSLRRIGAKNVQVDKLSLYEKENYEGVEMSVSGRVKGNLKQPIRSLGKTGPSSWTLYEEPDFDANPNGRFFCLKGSSTNFRFTRNIMTTYNLSRIGSVAQGCK